MRKVAINGNDFQDERLRDIGAFLVSLHGVGLKVYVAADFARYLQSGGLDLTGMEAVEEVPEDVSVVASIGGDGTFLRTAAWVGRRQTPIIGVNTGHLGYLAGFSMDRHGEVMAALYGDGDLTPRMTLEIESPFLPDDYSRFALNEVSVSKGDTLTMVTVNAYLDGRYLATYQGDGLVVATPTGSTAYNLSCGGPVIEPTLECFVLSPIAPHSLTLRPLVVGAASELRLEVSSRGSKCHVGIDGRTFSVPASGSEIIVRRADHMVNVVQPKGFDFSEVLREKLRWGEMPLR